MKYTIKEVLLFLLKAITALAAGYYIVLFLYISISRLAFPIAIDWVEGAVMIQVNHLLAGLDMYARPTAGYTALIYPPLYFYLAAATTKLFGAGFLPLRLTSLLSTCGCMLVLFLIVKRTAHSKLYALISAGFFAATYASVWSWFDFARVDMLYLLFCLLGLYFLSAPRRHANPILAALFFSLAFFTKQSAIFIILPLSLLYFLFDRKQALIFIPIVAIVALAGTLLLNYTTGGWYDYYIFTLPANHKLVTTLPFLFSLITTMLGSVLLALGLGIGPLLLEPRKSIQDAPYRFFLLTVAAVMAVSLVSALAPGSTHNAYIPVYATMAILLGIGLQKTQEKIVALDRSDNIKTVLVALLSILCLFQFAFLQYEPRDYLPAAQDWKRANALIKSLSATPGEIIVPMHGYLALSIGRQIFYDEAPLWELNGQVGKQPMPEWKNVFDETRHIVQSKQVSFVYMTEPLHTWQKMTCEKADIFNSNSKFVPTLYQMVCN